MLIWIHLKNQAENTGEHVEKLGALDIAGRDVEMVQLLWKTAGWVLKRIQSDG